MARKHSKRNKQNNKKKNHPQQQQYYYHQYYQSHTQVPEAKKTTTENATIEYMPTECWVNVFEFMELKEINSISFLLICPNITEKLLDSSNQSFFRLLCEPYFKRDLMNAIQIINERSNGLGFYGTSKDWKKNNQRIKPNVFSISKLRDKLGICILKAKVMFPGWFDDGSLDESIFKALKHSYSINRPGLHSPLYAEETEKERLKYELKVNTFLKEIEKKVDKQSKRPLRWQSIWRGYYLSNIETEIIDSTLELQQRVVNDETNTYIIEDHIHTFSKLFTMEPTLRRKIMFETMECPRKYKRKMNQSLIFLYNVVRVFVERIRGYYYPYSFENLLDFIVEESIEYGVKTPILTDCFLENNSLLHTILRWNKTQLSLKIIEKYAEVIKNCSIDYRFYLLVTCIRYKVDTDVIRGLFFYRIIDVKVLEHIHVPQSPHEKPIGRPLSLALYLMRTIELNSVHPSGYFIELINLFAECFDKKIPKQETPNDKLHKSMNRKYQEFVRECLCYKTNLRGIVTIREIILKLRKIRCFTHKLKPNPTQTTKKKHTRLFKQ